MEEVWFGGGREGEWYRECDRKIFLNTTGRGRGYSILLNFLLADGNLLFDLKLVTRNMLLLLDINVGNGALEPVAGVKVPIAKDENRSGGDNDNSVVHVLGSNGASTGKDKEDGDDDNPDTGDDTDRERETTQGDGAVLKCVAGIGDTAEGRETIGDVESNSRDTGDGREGSGVDEV